MNILIIGSNLIALFMLTCSIQKLRQKYSDHAITYYETIFYKTGFILFLLCSFIIAYYHLGNTGWIITINITSINTILITCLINYFPNFYKNWNNKIYSFIKTNKD